MSKQYNATLHKEGEYEYYSFKSEDYNVNIAAPMNKTTSTHAMTLCAVFNGLTSNTIYISQEESNYMFECDTDYLEILSIGETKIITITSTTNDNDLKYQIKEKPEWVVNPKFIIDSEQRLQFDVEANFDINEREGTIILIQNESNLELKIDIVQDANDGSNDYLKTTISIIEFSNSKLEITVPLILCINGNKINTTDIDIIAKPSGIVGGVKTIGTGSYINSPSMTQILKCENKNQCTGNVTYGYGTLSCSIQVKYKEETQEFYIYANTDEISLNEKGGEEYKATLSVTTNDIDWDYLYSGSYYHVEKTGTRNLTIYCPYDNDGDPHSEDILLQCVSDPTKVFAITVSQNIHREDVYALTVEPSEFEFEYSGGRKTFIVTSTKNGVLEEWEIIPNTSDYYTLRTFSNSLVISCPTNTSLTDTHIEKFVIQNAGVTKELDVKQLTQPEEDDAKELWEGSYEDYNNLDIISANTIYIVHLPKYEK